MTGSRSTIGVVEDDTGVRTALKQLLRAAGFAALTFATAEEFLSSDCLAQVDCLIADVNLPGMTGVALLKALDASGGRVPAVLITGRDDAGTIELMRQAGDVPRLHKPFSDDELFGAIRAVLRG
jgi:FixJ family two-component response regulator